MTIRIVRDLEKNLTAKLKWNAENIQIAQKKAGGEERLRENSQLVELNPIVLLIALNINDLDMLIKRDHLGEKLNIQNFKQLYYSNTDSSKDIKRYSMLKLIEGKLEWLY